jgi:hypothetical protein
VAAALKHLDGDRSDKVLVVTRIVIRHVVGRETCTKVASAPSVSNISGTSARFFAWPPHRVRILRSAGPGRRLAGIRGSPWGERRTPDELDAQDVEWRPVADRAGQREPGFRPDSSLNRVLFRMTGLSLSRLEHDV